MSCLSIKRRPIEAGTSWLSVTLLARWFGAFGDVPLRHLACFILGGGLMLATSLQAIRKRPGRVRALCLVVVLAGGLGMLFGGDSALSSALGRGMV